MKKDRGGILVARGGAIGDFLVTLPVLAALRSQFPDSRLEVLGYPQIVPLAIAGRLADEVRSIEARALAGFFARGGQLDMELAGYFGKFSVVVSYLYDPDGIFQENVGRCSTGQFVAGPHRPDERENRHATEVFLKPLERLGIFDADPVPRLLLIESPGSRLPPGRWLALHPGSGSERKNWPEANWQEFMLAAVAATDLNFLVVGGEAEGERLERLAAVVALGRRRVARNLPLSALAQELGQCVGFIGHDSGISHLASALGLNCAVLWGPSSITVWRPLGRNVQILQSDKGLLGIGVDDVLCRVKEWSPLRRSPNHLASTD